MRSQIEQRSASKLVPLARGPALWAFTFALCTPLSGRAGTDPGATAFRKQVQPILQEYCFDCHGDGANKGGVAFDEFKSDEAVLENHELWLKALKNLRAGL